MIRKVIKRHYNLIVGHPVVFSLIILVIGLMTFNNIQNNTIAHEVGYLAAIYSGMFIMDLLSIAYPNNKIAFPIKKPINKEFWIVIICTLLGLLFVSVRYFSDWEKLSGLIKLSVLPLVLFAFPIVLAIIYLFYFRYSYKELGVNLNYWYLPIIIIVIFGLATMSIVPQNSNWHLILEDGILRMLFMSFITAALSEEFTRMLIQSRIGSITHNMAIGWITAAIIWAAMHFPIFAQEHVKMGWRAVCMATLNLVPLGLLWGYITYRSKSIVPSVILHGLNFWGLQNF
jgi:membrane protease YdiL (CAAX protease family)